MKRFFLIAVISTLSIGAFAQAGTSKEKAQPASAPPQLKVDDVLKFNTEKHDFGKVKYNVPVTYYFELKNISNKPVVVENTYADCGCTTPEKIVEPIMPGATSKLKVQYNAATLGPINKEVFVKIAGIDQPKTVLIVGEVVQ